MVCRLRKALYGVKQAARQWHLELVKLMMCMGTTQSHADRFLFYRDSSDGQRDLILVYLDKTLLAAPRQSVINIMKDSVMSAFASRDILLPTFFWELHIWRRPDMATLTESQQQYTRVLLEQKELADANPVLLPMALGVQLQKGGELLDDIWR